MNRKKRKSELVELLSTPLRGTMSLTRITLAYQVKINGSVAFIKLHDGAQLSYLNYKTLHDILRLIWYSFSGQYTFHVHCVDDSLYHSKTPKCYITIDDANDLPW